MASLGHVSEGDPHPEAHNAERDAINDLKTQLATLLNASPEPTMAKVTDYEQGVTYEKDTLVVSGGYTQRALAETTEAPVTVVADTGNVTDTTKWRTVSPASVGLNGSTPEIVLINNTGSDNGLAISNAYPCNGGFPIGTATFKVFISGSADMMNLAVVSGNVDTTNWTDLASDSGQGFAAYGVMLDIYNDRIGRKTSNIDTSEFKYGDWVSGSADTPNGVGYEEWSLTFSEVDATTIAMDLYRKVGFVGRWTFVRPTGGREFNTFRLAASARTGGQVGKFVLAGSPKFTKKSPNWQRIAPVIDS